MSGTFNVTFVKICFYRHFYYRQIFEREKQNALLLLNFGVFFLINRTDLPKERTSSGSTLHR